MIKTKRAWEYRNVRQLAATSFAFAKSFKMVWKIATMTGRVRQAVGGNEA